MYKFKIKYELKGVFFMQQINCDAKNCAHNKSGICYSSSVNIGIVLSESCCDTFSNRVLYRGLTNNANSNRQCDFLTCEVESCIHNANLLCNLESISVSGLSSQTYSQTKCSSFDEKR